MTLSRWLRDYLYIPLGGNRGSVLFTYRNLFLTMLLGGLWHGASWTFVIWGALQGAYLIGERVIKERWSRREPMGWPTWVVRSLQWLLTFNLICFAWVFFRATSLDNAFDVLGQVVSFGGATTLVTPLLIVTILAMLASQFVPPEVPRRAEIGFARLAPLVQIGLLAIGLVVVNALGPEGIAPFIYFQF
jgi:D-alanyl-lipoteichoic acid acyltransferase DltB (MBOAT superfamily)